MVRIGFVGTGGIAAHHLEQLGKVEGAQVVALCDVVEARAQEAAGRFGGVDHDELRHDKGRGAVGRDGHSAGRVGRVERRKAKGRMKGIRAGSVSDRKAKGHA